MVRGEARIDRREDADRLRSEQQRQHRRAVDGDDRHGVAPPDPQLGEDGGGSVDVAGELRERQRERCVEVLGVR